MANPPPVVRHLIACEGVMAESGLSYSLQRVFFTIVQPQGQPFPCVRAPMALFAVLTSIRGKCRLGVELAFLDQGIERLLRSSRVIERDFGQDPTAVDGLVLRLREVRFPWPGQYTFYLVCDGQRIGQEYVEVR
jgi:hypothetical protein